MLGFNDYANAFDGPGEFLAGNNIAVFAYDQRGFGGAPDTGFWYDGAAKRRDLKDALQVLKDRYPGKPLYLLGESMGGAVVMTAAADPEIAGMINGAILSAPAVWGPSTQAWWQRSGLWLFAHTVPWMRPTGRGLGIQASDNIEMLRALGRDPKIIKKTRVDSVYGVVRLMDEALFSAPDLDLPLLILYGERDEVIPKKPTKQMLRSLPEAGRAARRIALYPEGWHMLLRDLQAETVWRDILAWIRRPDAPLPSGAEKGVERFLEEKG